MKQTKHSRKSEVKIYVQNDYHSCEHMHSNDYATAQSLMVSVTVSSLGGKLVLRSCTSWNQG